MGKYLNMIRQAEISVPLQRQSCPVETNLLVPGDRITWQGSEGKAHIGVIDFLHAYPSEVWAFCTLPDGRWTALNIKQIRKVEAS